MAAYDFKCTKCGVVQEHVCSISQRPETLPCPRCGSVSEQILLRAPGLMTGGMGVPSLDVVIGRDAEKRWSRITERQQVRNKVRKESGKQGLTATGKDEYKAHDKPLHFVSTPEPTGD